MKQETYYTILREWRAGGGLKRCLAGEDVLVYPLPPRERIAVCGRSTGPKETHIPWSDAEKAMVQSRYRKEGYTGLLADLPLRSKEAIRGCARRLGVQSTKCGMRA